MLQGLKRGYAVVSVNYRMSGEATFPALVHDVKAAIRWVRANAEKFLNDLDRFLDNAPLADMLSQYDLETTLGESYDLQKGEGGG